MEKNEGKLTGIRITYFCTAWRQSISSSPYDEIAGGLGGGGGGMNPEATFLPRFPAELKLDDLGRLDPSPDLRGGGGGMVAL
mmetsp:Transcript_10942/g.23145  ORF Transcript_10942/g.23145 Transcript_10942/m.23145 type:complete len:82 (+) Transcript_10942:916-1161(+)